MARPSSLQPPSVLAPPEPSSASVLLKQVLGHLARHKLAATPENYAAAYHAVLRTASEDPGAPLSGQLHSIDALACVLSASALFPGLATECAAAIRKALRAPGQASRDRLHEVERILSNARYAESAVLQEAHAFLSGVRSAVASSQSGMAGAVAEMEQFEHTASRFSARVESCDSVDAAKSALSQLSGEIQSLLEALREAREDLGRSRAELDGTARELVAAKEDGARADYLARYDPLTGVFNRRGLEAELLRMPKAPTVVLELDLDDFKKINDRFGHNTGDAVLSRVAKVLRHALRESDILARLGGEEFVIVMPNTHLDQTAGVCSRILDEIRAIAGDTGDKTGPKVTASGGLAAYRNGAASLEQFKVALTAADKHLYRAKQLGKDRIFGHIESLEWR